MAQLEGQQHPISVYLKVWGLLFILSTASYLVDFYHVESYLRWFLILLFMALKAGLIIAVFMHMMWERLALLYAISLPPLFIAVFITIMALESDNTLFSRLTFFNLGT